VATLMLFSKVLDTSKRKLTRTVLVLKD